MRITSIWAKNSNLPAGAKSRTKLPLLQFARCILSNCRVKISSASNQMRAASTAFATPAPHHWTTRHSPHLAVRRVDLISKFLRRFGILVFLFGPFWAVSVFPWGILLLVCVSFCRGFGATLGCLSLCLWGAGFILIYYSLYCCLGPSLSLPMCSGVFAFGTISLKPLLQESAENKSSLLLLPHSPHPGCYVPYGGCKVVVPCPSPAHLHLACKPELTCKAEETCRPSQVLSFSLRSAHGRMQLSWGSSVQESTPLFTV